MAKTRTRVADVDFVRAYASSNSVSEVAAKLGVSTASVATRASSLRTKGVMLPKFIRGRKQTDVAALNALLAGMGVVSSPLPQTQDTEDDNLVPIRPAAGKRGRPSKKA